MTLAETIHCIATLDYLADELLVTHNESVAAARHYLRKEKALLTSRSNRMNNYNSRKADRRKEAT